MNAHITKLIIESAARVLCQRPEFAGLSVQIKIDPETQNAAPGAANTQDGGQKSENEPPRNSASHYNTMEVVNQ